jgi:5S rRNA maturation endonuclease (ribonuclease M5)
VALQWEKIAPLIAVDILGQPTKKDSTHLRWGNKGSLALDLENGTFYDFEGGEGYGLITFLESKGLDVDAILAPYKDETPNITPVNITEVKVKKTNRTFTDKQMFDLKEQSEIFVRYSDSFCVMRFPVDHYIKQKYAPFTKVLDNWEMCRPEGQLPIYCTNKNPEGYVIINEGEKASIGCESIVQDKADVCCWHGGVNAISKQDWSPLTNRKVIIFPDNDQAGLKVANELQQLLTDITEECLVVKPPRDFKDKDDLYDANEINYFKSTEDFLEYCVNNTYKERVSFEFTRASDVVKNIKPANWLVKDIAEYESVLAIFGQAKSGKSFVAVDLACSVAQGRDWHGHKVKQSNVLYLCGEGVRGLGRRVFSWGTLNENQDISDMPLFISNRGSRMLDEKDFILLKDTANKIEAEHGEIGLIVVDTLQRNFGGGGNENSTEDMSTFIERIDDLRDTYGSTIAIVHHTGHSNSGRARGSSVIQASVDWEYKVERSNSGDDMFVKLSQTLVKDGKPMKEKNFQFIEQKLSFIDDTTSGALKFINAEDMPKEAKEHAADSIILKEIEKMQNASSDPSSVWVQAKDLYGLVDAHSDVTIRKRLGELKEQGKLLHENKKYQLKEKNLEGY